jgi:hypothetical protein
MASKPISQFIPENAPSSFSLLKEDKCGVSVLCSHLFACCFRRKHAQELAKLAPFDFLALQVKFL